MLKVEVDVFFNLVFWFDVDGNEKNWDDLLVYINKELLWMFDEWYFNYFDCLYLLYFE